MVLSCNRIPSSQDLSNKLKVHVSVVTRGIQKVFLHSSLSYEQAYKKIQLAAFFSGSSYFYIIFPSNIVFFSTIFFQIYAEDIYQMFNNTFVEKTIFFLLKKHEFFYTLRLNMLKVQKHKF